MKILQIAVVDGELFALTSDGRLWVYDTGAWLEIPVPGNEA